MHGSSTRYSGRLVPCHTKATCCIYRNMSNNGQPIPANQHPKPVALSTWRGQSRREATTCVTSQCMDVDATVMTTMSEDERKKLCTEGWCFHCKNQGHISCNCPKKCCNGNCPPFCPQTISSTLVTACITEVIPEEGASQALKIIHGLTAEDWTKLLDDLILDSSTDELGFLPARITWPWFTPLLCK